MLNVHAIPRAQPVAASPSQAIHKLPGELLVTIFWYCAVFDKPGYLQWTCVLAVCRRWRAVGLGCPSLWRTVCAFRNEDCARTVLLRSKNMLLDIRITELNARSLDAAKALLEHASRAKKLSLHIPMSLADVVRGTTAKIAAVPRLEQLHLVIDDDLRCGSALPVGALFPCGLSSLTDLTMIITSNIGDLPLLPNLQRLGLQADPVVFGAEGCYVNLVSLLGVLASAPQLEILHLSYLIPHVDSAILPNLPTINFQALRRLELEGYASDITKFGRYFTIPNSAQLNLDCHCSTPDDIVAIIQSLSALFYGLDSQGRREQRTLRSLSLAQIFDGFVIQGSTNEDDQFLPGQTNDDEGVGELCLKMMCDGWLADESDMRLDRITETLPLTEVRTLDVVGPEVNNFVVPGPLRRLVQAIAASAPDGEQTWNLPPAGTATDAEYLQVEKEWRKIFFELREIRWSSGSSSEGGLLEFDLEDNVMLS
ncbi:hypothetical protein PsYK624_099540 [Phanerochaete sordida]|uniref:F-box domain-containing protein n=1 Tax=Phanerochaete sordida TaxID=48140 RepID=A0A9P3LH63_9APHY|nr:hypothetical protein PsYK624_099540 [Phanerochaete sordida]